tara:strand:+ start:42 stop:257 length:216 start_codon:yes stop_codon:yes gene_type:complete
MDYAAYQEECDYQLNAQYDYVSEAYGGDVECLATLEAEEEYYAYLNLDAAMDAMEARGGPDYKFNKNPIPF